METNQEQKKESETMLIILDKHTNEDNAFIVDDYPWGFRLRCKIRYWIETTKSGDRFVRQTQNPKTGLWCAPKRSTYDEVMVMTSDSRGYIGYFGFHLAGANLKELESFLIKVGDYPFNDLQQKKIKEARAYLKTMEHVTFTCRVQEFRHKVTGEIKTELGCMELNDYEPVKDEENEKKQEEIKQGIKQLYAHNLKAEGLI